MKKIILNKGEYSFNPTAKTVTVSAHTELFTKEYLLLITNTTTNDIIYNFGCDGYGGIISGSTITLEYDTTAMLSTDSLQIIMYTENSDVDTLTLSLLETLRKQTEVQDEMLEELKLCSKYLRKIYNPE